MNDGGIVYISTAVLSGSSSTTPTPVGAEEGVSSSGQPSTAETVKLLQTVSSATSTTATGGRERRAAGGGGTAAEGEKDDNIVTTIDEVCAHWQLPFPGSH